jgi:hypothetical protein
MDFKDKIISEVADTASRKITRRIIATLQQMKDGMQSGEDSGLANLWDEVCVQVQGEESIFWDMYKDLIKRIIIDEVRREPTFVQQALWLQTEAGFDWIWEIENGDESSTPFYSDEEIDQEIADYILGDIIEKAEEWSNPRIRDYLDREYEGYFNW